MSGLISEHTNVVRVARVLDECNITHDTYSALFNLYKETLQLATGDSKAQCFMPHPSIIESIRAGINHQFLGLNPQHTKRPGCAVDLRPVLSTLADREDYSSDHAMGVFMIQIDGTEAERGRKLVAVGVRDVTKLSYTVQGLQSIQKEDDMLDLQLWELLPKEDETFEVYKDELDR